VVAELFLIWDDIQPFDDPQGHYPKPAFSVEEQQAIQQYHAAWKKCSDEFPDTNLPIEEFQGTQTWQKLHEAARIALDVFSIRGLLPED
jgi:hypothetical protein